MSLGDLNRAGVWRRCIAACIDLLVAMVVIQLVAAIAYPLSSGRVTYAGSFITSCESTRARPEGIVVPKGFTANFEEICTKSFFGLTTARYYAVGHKEQNGSGFTTTSYNFGLGPGGSPIKSLDLDLFFFPVFILLRWALDRTTRGSLGRRWTSTRIVDPDGLRNPESLAAAVTQRYIRFSLPYLPGFVLGLVLVGLSFASRDPTPSWAPLFWVARNLPVWVSLISAFIAILSRRDAFYDAAAGTAVARLVPSAEPALVDPEAQEEPKLLGRVPDTRSAIAVRSEPNGFAIPWLSCALAMLLIAVFLAEVAFPAAPAGPNGLGPATFLKFGGMTEVLVVMLGQWFRLLASILLHGNATHLLLNMIALLLAGWLLERRIGKPWFGAIFILGGLAGSLASITFNPAMQVSVGASGAVLALLSTAFVVSFHVPEGPGRRRLQSWSLALVLPSLLSRANLPGGLAVDFPDHVGGVVAGLVLGLLILQVWKKGPERPPYARAALGAALAVSAGLLVTIGVAGVSPSGLSTLMIPADALPKSDNDWIAQSADLAQKYPNDPRVHLARAGFHALQHNAAERDRELARAEQLDGEFEPNNAAAFGAHTLIVVGNTALAHHDPAQAREIFDRAIAAYPNSPTGYSRRAAAEFDDGALAPALKDLETTAMLNPKEKGVYTLEGDLEFARGNIEAAMERYDSSLKLQGDDAVTYRSRGLARFYAKRNADAVSDLEAAATQAPKDPYSALWLDIVFVRSGWPDRLKASSGDLDRWHWPGPVVRFFLGEIDEKALMAAAADPDAATQTGQICEANYYLGEWKIMHHADAAAEPYLSAAAQTCPKSFTEWAAARAELAGAAGYIARTSSFEEQSSP